MRRTLNSSGNLGVEPKEINQRQVIDLHHENSIQVSSSVV